MTEEFLARWQLVGYEAGVQIRATVFGCEQA